MIPIIEERNVVLADAEATLGAGAAIAPHLVGGMVVTLSGDLGAGKTTLVRGALRRLGWTGAVKSPSYTLIFIGSTIPKNGTQRASPNTSCRRQCA